MEQQSLERIASIAIGEYFLELKKENGGKLPNDIHLTNVEAHFKGYLSENLPEEDIHDVDVRSACRGVLEKPKYKSKYIRGINGHYELRTQYGI